MIALKISLKEFFDRSTVITFLVCIILISLISGSTLAYRTTKGITDNVITSGQISVDLLNLQGDGTDMPECIYSILPNTDVTNIVKAQNDGKNPEYIRIKYEPVIKNEFNKDLSIEPISFNIDEEHWTYKDGYYYYYTILYPNQTSFNLWDTVHFGAEIDNSYKFATLTVDITVEAIQSENNGLNVFEAQGWEVVYKQAPCPELHKASA